MLNKRTLLHIVRYIVCSRDWWREGVDITSSKLTYNFPTSKPWQNLIDIAFLLQMRIQITPPLMSKKHYTKYSPANITSQFVIYLDLKEYLKSNQPNNYSVSVTKNLPRMYLFSKYWSNTDIFDFVLATAGEKIST